MESAAPPMSSLAAPASAEKALTALEVGIIDFFVSALKALGVPKSIGELYGLLFASPEPLPLDVLAKRLSMSKGSASQGLKILRAVGAVKTVYVEKDRRDHFTAETEIKRLVAGLVRREVQPRLENAERRLERLRAIMKESQDTAQNQFYEYRLAKLSWWSSRSREVLPLLESLLE